MPRHDMLAEMTGTHKTHKNHQQQQFKTVTADSTMLLLRVEGGKKWKWENENIYNIGSEANKNCVCTWFCLFSKTHHTARTHNIVLSSHSAALPHEYTIQNILYGRQYGMRNENEPSAVHNKKTTTTTQAARRNLLKWKGTRRTPSSLTHDQSGGIGRERKKLWVEKPVDAFGYGEMRKNQNWMLLVPQKKSEQKKKEEKKRANTQSQNLC